MNRRLQKNGRSTLSLFLFIGPFLLIFGVFFLFPLIKGIAVSFTNWNGIGKELTFTGLRNYIDLFTNDKRFLNSILVTSIFTFFYVVISNIVGIILAIIIEGSRFRTILRTCFFLPYVMSLVVVGFIWRILYTEALPDLGSILNWQFLNIDFIGNPNIALFSVILMNIWYSVGYFLVIYIAGIQSIDGSLIDSAKIDGAKGLKQIIYIIIPLLMPSITVCVFTSLANSFRVFDAIFVLTGGGPGYATETIALNIYYEAFGAANKFGYGMAKAVILALIVLFVSYFQLRFFKAREVEA